MQRHFGRLSPRPHEHPMAPTDHDQRQALRRQFRAKRRALSAQQQKDHAQAIARWARGAPELQNAACIGLYMASDGEVDVAALAQALDEKGRLLALPVVGEGSEMDFYRYEREQPLAANRFGIPEPPAGAALVDGESLDVLLVPLVAFDDQGARLGMGAGFYDRYLARIDATRRPMTIGVAHEIQHAHSPLPTAHWDVPLDGVITEQGWHPGR